MAIDSIQGRSGISTGELEGAGGAPAQTDGSPRAVREPSSASSWAGAFETASSVAGIALSMSRLAANSSASARISPQQAQVFDFLAILGRILQDAAEFLRGDDARSTRAPVAATAPKNGGTASTSTESRAHTQGETTSGGTSLKSQAEGHASAEARATSSSFSGPDGVGTAAEARARLGIEASASGAITSDYGSVSGSIRASAELYARAKAYAMANSRGARAGAEVEIGAHLEIDAQVDASTLGGNVTVHAEGIAEAGSGAKVKATAGISYEPLEAAVNAKAGAFAGARAGFEAEGGLAGVKYGVSGELRAGVGLNAEINAGIEDGKVRFSFGFGVSVGVGFSTAFDVEIDFKAMGKALGDLFGAIADLFGGNEGDWSHAASALTQFIGSIPSVKEQAKKLAATTEAYASYAP